MDKKKILLYTQAILCILWTVLMAAAAISIFRQGTAYQAQGHPEVWIYTREKAAAAFLKLLPLLLPAIGVTIVSLVLKVRDENQDRPQALPWLTALYKTERAQAEMTKEDHNGQVLNKNNPRSDVIRKARIALFVLAAVFIVTGIFNGSMEDMLIKAINICTECVGLG